MFGKGNEKPTDPNYQFHLRYLNLLDLVVGHFNGPYLAYRNDVAHKRWLANKVAIELNAHPSRLDIDWRYIAYALEKNVFISIDPDAHTIDGFDDIRYGVLAAQKAMLTKQQNLSSFGLAAFEAYLAAVKKTT